MTNWYLRHPRESGDPQTIISKIEDYWCLGDLKRIDSPFQGNDDRVG
jgi:hypothetical protein